MKIYLSAKVAAVLLQVEFDAILAKPDGLVSVLAWENFLRHDRTKLIPAFSYSYLTKTTFIDHRDV
jgi:hypothetical protein